MKKNILTLGFVFYSVLLFAQKWTGNYSYSKGVNKEQASIYLNHYQNDSAFFYLTYMSGMPDFNTFSIKGFMAIHDDDGSFVKNDSNKLKLILKTGSIKIIGDSLFNAEPGILHTYKKQGNALKKNSTIFIDYIEKQGKTKTDSCVVLSVPIATGPVIMSLQKGKEVKIIDEFGSYYMVEVADKNTEFLWIAKKNLTLLKTP